MRTTMVDPHELRPNPWNTNSVAPDNMEKLKRSISDLGFCTAVVVRQLDSGELEILGGQHRTQAAIALGIERIPVVNLGEIEENRAKKIGLVDNSRYGTDDSLSLAQLLDDIGVDRSELAGFLPMDENEIDAVFSAADIDLDNLDFIADEDDEEDDPTSLEDAKERPAPTHTQVRFRVPNADAEAISRLIEKTISREGIDEGDEATNAGAALAHLLLNSNS